MVPSEEAARGDNRKKVSKKCGLAHHLEEEELITRWWNTSSTACDKSTTITTTANWLQLGLPVTTSTPHCHHLNLAVAATATVVATPLTPPSVSASSSSSSSSSSLDFKLINPRPPLRKPLPSLWFTLLPSPHQCVQPSSPRLSKSFLRIKDEKLKVRLVMKYVAHKLGLDCESQVEIRCRGQVVEPTLTLEQVRHKMWSPNQQAMTLIHNSAASPKQHILLLHYTTSSSSTSSTYRPSS
ncbi:hypothetical protein vseg_002248 [Gypsophila vaccaria]